MIIPFGSHTPAVGQNVFVAPSAWLIGMVELGDNCTVFFGAVLRGDLLSIKVGQQTNIQEHALLHTTAGRCPTIVGNQVTVGHRAILHGCSIGNRVLVGMGATILDQAEVEDDCLIGAGTLITEGKKIPRGSLVLGSPGKVVRTLTEEELTRLKSSAAGYVALGKDYCKYFGA